ncbi:short chain dehydrogenase [Shewanella algicola]|nr:short chain dehydrogenase [Shewanella algicola]GGP58349.1 short chain dehydrogenase [Shewanella algicola]
MKIVLIGATGMIGKAVAQELHDHDVISVGYNNGDYQVDIEDIASIEALFASIGQVDAVISTTGLIAFAPITELSQAQIVMTVNNKLIGHIALFQVAQKYICKGGSFTMTSGYLAQHPMVGSSVISVVNAGLDSFAKAAALEFGNALRTNTVSPHFVKETMELMGMDSTDGVSAADTAKAYRVAIETNVSGAALDTKDYI